MRSLLRDFIEAVIASSGSLSLARESSINVSGSMLSLSFLVMLNYRRAVWTSWKYSEAWDL
jgi:hypothetical protein